MIPPSIYVVIFFINLLCIRHFLYLNISFPIPASVEDLLFDDELRVVSQDIDEDDAGVVSPVPEVQEFEDLPEDEEQLFEDLTKGSQEPREPSPPAKRQKPESQEVTTTTSSEVRTEASSQVTQQQQQVIFQTEEATVAVTKVVTGHTLEQVEEHPVAEQTTTTPTPASPTPKEPESQQQQVR